MSGGFLGISPPNFFLIASSCPEENIIMFSTTSRATFKETLLVILSQKECRSDIR